MSFFPAGGSLLLSHDVHSPDISIDMDEVQKERGQMQLLQEQVNYITFSNAWICTDHPSLFLFLFLSLSLSLFLQDTYIQERADAMANIHSTIVELGQIFRQLATMVREQEEQVTR